MCEMRRPGKCGFDASLVRVIVSCQSNDFMQGDEIMIKARDIMSKEVKYIQEDVTIKETLIRMKGEGTSSFIVERKAFLDLPKDGGSAGESMDALIHEAYSDE